MNMFINTRTNDELDSYKKLLRVIGSLSNLFADTSVPYISYRVSENLFCRVFSAKNLSRSDVSEDLSIAKQGRKGLDGERSGLFWEVIRIHKQCRPKYFVYENVASMKKEWKNKL